MSLSIGDQEGPDIPPSIFRFDDETVIKFLFNFPYCFVRRAIRHCDDQVAILFAGAQVIVKNGVNQIFIKNVQNDDGVMLFGK